MAGKQQKRGLGRGLGALIPQGETPKSGDVPEATGAPGSFRVAIEQIHPHPDQPRRHFREEAIEELAASIREQGLLQPLLVRRRPQGGYELIAGERRWRASKRAGLKDVPVTVRDATDRETLELALVENLQREDLNPVELARGYEALMQDHGYTQEQLARRIGRDRSSIANTLRLLRLSAEIRQDLVDGKLSAGHAKAILSVEEPSLQLRLREEILKKGLSVRDVEKRARELVMGSAERPRPRKEAREGPAVDPDVAALVNRLERNLGVKIDLRHSGKKGKGRLTIRYGSLDQLQPILDKLES